MKIAIVGAGATGLSAAYDLSKAGHHVTVYEAQDTVGGLAAGFKEPHWDWTLEKFYHHWFASDSAIKELIRELGWQDKLQYHRPTTVAYHRGDFYPLDSVASVLKFPGLDLTQTTRFGFVTLYLKYLARWQQLESSTAHRWLNRWYGETVYHTLWQPMLEGKFGPFYQDVNMAWMWARLKARTPQLGTFEGGFQSFFSSLADHLTRNGSTFMLETPVQKIELKHKQIEVTARDNKAMYEQVLVTLSPQFFARLTPSLPQEYLHDIHQLKHTGAVVVIFALKQPLSPEGHYWYNLPKSEGFPFLSLVEHTNFVDPQHFGGDHLVYCGDYRLPEHKYFSLPEKQLTRTFQSSLTTINPKFESSWIKKTWVFRAPYAQPVPFTHHSQNIPSINTPIKNLFFASMSHIYPWDRGTNFAVNLGRQVAQRMME